MVKNLKYSTAKFAAVYLPVTLTYVISAYAIATGGPYAYISVGPVGTHAWTAMLLALAYLLADTRLGYLAMPARQLISLTLIVAGVHFYDTLWGAFGYVSGGSFSYSSLGALFAASAVLVLFHERHWFIEPTHAAFLVAAVLLVALAAMYAYGFWGAMRLYEAGAGPDPNHSILWAISKVGVYAPLLATATGTSENETLEWSL